MKKQHLLYIAVTIFLCLSVTATAFASDNYELNTSTAVTEEYFSNVGNASLAFTNLFESFRSNPSTNEASDYSVSGVYASQFPEYYAGAYINTDGKLVILLMDSLTETEIEAAKADICERAQYDDFVFGTAKNSYSSLVDAMNEVSNYMSSENAQSPIDIVGSGLDDYLNAITVDVKLDDSISSTEAYKILKNTFSHSSMMIFESTNSSIVFTDSVDPEPLINNTESTALVPALCIALLLILALAVTVFWKKKRAK